MVTVEFDTSSLTGKFEPDSIGVYAITGEDILW